MEEEENLLPYLRFTGCLGADSGSYMVLGIGGGKGANGNKPI